MVFNQLARYLRQKLDKNVAFLVDKKKIDTDVQYKNLCAEAETL